MARGAQASDGQRSANETRDCTALALAPRVHRASLRRSPRVVRSGQGGWAVLSEVFRTGGRHRDHRDSSGSAKPRHETAVVGILPHWKTRARRPPRLEHVGVRAGFGSHPLQQIEDEGIDGVRHGRSSQWRRIAAVARLSPPLPPKRLRASKRHGEPASRPHVVDGHQWWKPATIELPAVPLSDRGRSSTPLRRRRSRTSCAHERDAHLARSATVPAEGLRPAVHVGAGPRASAWARSRCKVSDVPPCRIP